MANEYLQQERIRRKLAQVKNRTPGFGSKQRTMNFSPANPTFNNYQGFKEALENIYSGKTNSDHYENITGIQRDRLRVTQSIRDRNLRRPLRHIKKMNQAEIEKICSIF